MIAKALVFVLGMIFIGLASYGRYMVSRYITNLI